MKTQYYTASSLDGFIATENHELDWLLQFDDAADTSYTNFIQNVGAIIMGSHTYMWILDRYLRFGTNQEKHWSYKQPSWVLTRRELPIVKNADVRFASGDIGPIYQQACTIAKDKNIWIVGGGDLAGQFYDAGFLDEIIVQIAPVTLGHGMPLFPRNTSFLPLHLNSIQKLGTVFAELHYTIPKQEGL